MILHVSFVEVKLKKGLDIIFTLIVRELIKETKHVATQGSPKYECRRGMRERGRLLRILWLFLRYVDDGGTEYQTPSQKGVLRGSWQG